MMMREQSFPFSTFASLNRHRRTTAVTDQMFLTQVGLSTHKNVLPLAAILIGAGTRSVVSCWPRMSKDHKHQKPEEPIPFAGPHGTRELTDPEKTPGSGGNATTPHGRYKCPADELSMG